MKPTLFDYYPVPVTLQAKPCFSVGAAVRTVVRWFKREPLVEKLRRVGGI